MWSREGELQKEEKLMQGSVMQVGTVATGAQTCQHFLRVYRKPPELPISSRPSFVKVFLKPVLTPLHF